MHILEKTHVSTLVILDQLANSHLGLASLGNPTWGKGDCHQGMVFQLITVQLKGCVTAPGNLIVLSDVSQLDKITSNSIVNSSEIVQYLLAWVNILMVCVAL